MGKVILAKTAGFCFGVKRAVDLAYSHAEDSEHVYTYGPIIHNETVVGDLETRGVHVLSSIQEAEEAPKGTIIILMIPAGRRSKCFSTISESFSSSSLPVPNESTMTETGLATPIA